MRFTCFVIKFAFHFVYTISVMKILKNGSANLTEETLIPNYYMFMKWQANINLYTIEPI